MKKIFTLGFMMLFASYGFAQSTHTIDFEPSGVGADWTWIVDQNDDNPPLEILSNSVSGGINTSATIGKFTARLAGQPWALFITTGDGEFTFDATNSTVKMMVYKTVISDVGFKVEGAGPATEVKVANTKTNEWEELTFDFSAVEGQRYNKLVIIPDFDFTPRGQENIIFVDNIQVPDGVAAGPESVPATVTADPTKQQADVYSLFSSTYVSNAPSSWTQAWGSGDVADVVIDGSDAKKYTNLNFQAITLSSTIDLAAYTHIHFDVWTPVANKFGIKFQDFGPDNVDEYPNVDDSEMELESSTEQIAETWVSHDFAISDFTGLTGTANVGQIQVLLGSIAGGVEGTVYFDNVYFYKDTPTSVSDLDVKALKLYPNPVADILRVQGSEEGEIVDIYSLAGSLVKSVPVEGGAVSVTDLSRGVYFVKVNGSTTKITKK